MPTKKKGKKSGDGKKKAKKDDGDTVTFKEAVMTYQMEVKQSQLIDLKEDIEDLKFRNERQRQRNHFLKKEQNRHVKDVIEQAHEKEKESRNREQIPYEDVEKALQEKLAAVKIEEESVEEVKEKISLLDEDIQVLSNELQELQNYKGHGQTFDKIHIDVLKKEMDDMEKSYTEMADFFEKSLTTIKHTITRQNEENITKHKKLASEGAIHNLDRQTEQEFLDNKWLLKEVEIHREHIAGVEAQVERLEQENIEVISNLFEQQLEDVNETRQFYLACKEEENEDIPTGALVPVEELDEEEIIEKNGEIGMTDQLPDDMKWLDNYLTEFDDVASEDDYKLGPMEIKLLCVVGKKMKIQRTGASSSDVDGSQKEEYKRWVAERDELSRVKSNDSEEIVEDMCFYKSIN